MKLCMHCVYGTLLPLSISTKLFSEISMDFIMNLSSSVYNDYMYNNVLVVVNQYTKIVYYLFITKLINICNLTDFMYCHIFLMFDWLKGIILDKSSVFINSYWSAVYEHIKIKRHLSTAFHPQMNDQTEWQNSTLK